MLRFEVVCISLTTTEAVLMEVLCTSLPWVSWNCSEELTSLSLETLECEYFCSTNFSCFYKSTVSHYFRIGAAMILDILSVPPVYSRLLNNPLCTLLYEEISRSPDDWEDVRNISGICSFTKIFVKLQIPRVFP